MGALSVITIAKDNAETITSVVENGLAIGNEVIVVDTGSKDATPVLAEKAGARVIFCQLEAFDYSTPRNQGAEAAKNDWVLHLDTDEKIDVKFKERIHEKINEQKFGCYNLVQTTYTGTKPIPESSLYQKRLYRKGDFGYTGLVYETLFPVRVAGHAEAHIQNRPTGINKNTLRRPLLEGEFRSLTDIEPQSIEHIISKIERLHTLKRSAGNGVNSFNIASAVQSAFTKGLSIDPLNEILTIEMAKALALLNQPEKAAQIMGRLENKATSHHYWEEYAAALYESERFEEAKTAIDKAIEIYPNSYNHMIKGTIYLAQGEGMFH